MNDDNLMQRIDELVSTLPHDVVKIQESADALERRLRTVFDDLGLGQLAPLVTVHPGAGYEIVMNFPALDRRVGDRVLRRLEDIQRALPPEQQIQQDTSLF